MKKTRKEIEVRILEILSYLKNDELIAIFKGNPSIFNDEDLEMILGFLETGENRFLGEFIDKKIKESEELILKINNDKILVGKKKKLEEEKDERESEEEEVEELLNF